MKQCNSPTRFMLKIFKATNIRLNVMSKLNTIVTISNNIVAEEVKLFPKINGQRSHLMYLLSIKTKMLLNEIPSRNN